MIKATDTDIFEYHSFRKNHVDMVAFLGKKVFKKDFSKHDEDKLMASEEDVKIFSYKNSNPEHLTPQDIKKISKLYYNHVKSSSHHPEYWDDSLDEESYDFRNPPEVHAENMPKEALIEMCCDWAACSISNNSSFSTWYNKVVDKRIFFTKGQKTIIKSALKRIYDFALEQGLCFGGIDSLEYDGKAPKFKESKEKFTVAFIFGRMNPFTIGHLKVVDTLLSLEADSHRLYLSHTQDKPKKDPLKCKNPLPFYLKKIYANAFLKDSKRPITIEESEAHTIFAVIKELWAEGVTSIKVVAGSDRISSFQELLEKYNGYVDPVTGEEGYNFDSIEVVSAGDRDPDSEDAIESMSASKIRQLAVEGNFEEFQKGIPTSDKYLIKDLYDDLRKYMGIEKDLV